VLADLRAYGKQFLRSWAATFFIFIFPLLLLGLFGAIFSNTESSKINLHVQDQDGTPTSALFLDILNGTGSVNVVLVDEGADLQAYIREKSATAALLIPAGFEADVYETLAGNRTGLVNVTLYADPSQAAAMGIAQGAVGGALTGLNFALSNTRPVTGMDFEPVAGAGLTAIDFFLPGILGMTILTTPFFGMANTCAEYRARGYFKFLATTTLRKGEWLLSKALWYSALLILAMFVMIAFGLVLFEMTLTLTPLALVIVVAGTMMFVSMGMLIGVFLRDVETATAVANAIGFPMMFLAGSFFPLETMPGALRAVAAAMPLTYVNEGLRATMVYRNDATALVHLGVVLVLTAVFFVVAARAMSWKGK